MLRNSMSVEFMAISDNERFARSVAAAFVIGLDPTMEEISEIKTAISEAVTNAIIHGYNDSGQGRIVMEGIIYEDTVEFRVSDEGVGISDIRRAREPLYTGKPEDERSGMGFTIMETFMDSVEVESEKNKGTSIIMTKTIKQVGK
ncbi:MAG: anti-sigma F factor [Clostridia bacterium]|nr:anti-sigma F factor [Clostridia bacterium]